MTAVEMTNEEFRTIAKTNAKTFVDLFLEALNLKITDVENISELSESEQVHGLYCKEVYSEGGYEGGGEHAEKVFKITDKSFDFSHFRVVGYYDSYEGTNWDDAEIEIVEPREVMVTKYFPV